MPLHRIGKTEGKRDAPYALNQGHPTGAKVPAINEDGGDPRRQGNGLLGIGRLRDSRRTPRPSRAASATAAVTIIPRIRIDIVISAGVASGDGPGLASRIVSGFPRLRAFRFFINRFYWLLALRSGWFIKGYRYGIFGPL